MHELLHIQMSDGSGHDALTPATLDARHLRVVLEAIEQVIYPNGRRAAEEPLALLAIETGSAHPALHTPAHATACPQITCAAVAAVCARELR